MHVTCKLLLLECSLEHVSNRGGSRGVAKYLQEGILISFDFILKVLLSVRNFATLLDPSAVKYQLVTISSLKMICSFQILLFANKICM